MKMRPPATPILNIDPYFSVWTEESVLQNTIHWTGKPNTMSGTAFVDGKAYHFLGHNDAPASIRDMRVEGVDVDAYSTVITLSCPEIRLVAHFTSPLMVDDLYYASRPVTYCKVSFEALDGKNHEVKVRFAASEELVLNRRGEGRALSWQADIPGVTAIRMGNGIQNVLHCSGDDIRIDWGYLYLGVKGAGKVENMLLNGLYAVSVEAKVEKEALFLFAYDDIHSIKYFDRILDAYWRKDGTTIRDAIAEAAEDYETVLARCNAFSEKLKADAIARGNEKYAELLMLAVRHVMAAHKLVLDEDGNVLFISKECHSNGCAATVDVTYPSAPLFLLYNPELLKGMLRPVMKYAASPEWTFDFAPHDVGQYPLVDGQRYYVTRKPDGTVYINPDGQMPVEECGNMLILFAALCDTDDSTAFVEPYLDTVRQWSEYLIRYGLDPENQLCTDDFAGHLAHNVNLSIKAIMGITGYSRILSRRGETAEAARLMEIARGYAAALVERAANPDGSFRLAYDRPGTFSLKYNSIWDRMWETNLFPDSFYRGEIARYKQELLPYGVPLDSREKYTKSDWLVWAASLAEKREDFCLLVDSLWSAYNTMRTWMPMTDWYFCDTACARMWGNEFAFRHRTVQGGLFIKLLLGDKGC